MIIILKNLEKSLVNFFYDVNYIFIHNNPYPCLCIHIHNSPKFVDEY